MSIFSEKERKEMMNKRKYYSEHPEEARRAYLETHKEDWAPIAEPPIIDDNKDKKE